MGLDAGLGRTVWERAMLTIRPAIDVDADLLPEIERSSGELFRKIPQLAWIADDDVQSATRHREIIQQGTAWVALSESELIIGFLSAEVHMIDSTVIRAHHLAAGAKGGLKKKVLAVQKVALRPRSTSFQMRTDFLSELK